ncbi:MAG: hypothetical protein A2148_06625 [Chloroflexi bacterium RBG_16_68_14]|nr:MAG: hypothetical protein A2148_06625 [Chloroflexi bacterium RBG_16_68_14]
MVWALLAVLVAACNGNGGVASPTATSTAGTTEAPTREPGARLSTVEIVRKLRPSVVQVVTEGAQLNVFGELVPSRGLGTGVIIDAEGLIVTNNHVVRVGDALASRITVTLADGRTLSASVVGADPQTDLAVLKIDAQGLTPAELGDVSALPVGADVVAMGFALGLEGDPTVTRGVVSAKNRTIQEQSVSINDAIQTDASINPGNSGGPLVDDRGRVVGISTAIIQGGENIGFAISIDLVKPIVEELIRNGRVERGFLGVRFTDITPSLARNLGLPAEEGVGLAEVVAGSPADEADLRPEDIIIALGDTKIRNSGDLLEALRRHRAGERVKVRFYRDGDEQETEVTLGAQPE